MTQTNPEVAAQKRKRFAEKKFRSYEDAKAFQVQASKAADSLVQGLCKAKIFARWDGTYDVVLYSDVAKAAEQDKKANAILKEGVEEAKKVHGLSSKQRRKRDRKGI